MIKKFLLTLLFFFFWTQLTYWAEYWNFKLTIRDWDTKESVYTIVENYKDDSLFVWNTFTKDLMQINWKRACSNLEWRLSWEYDRSDEEVNFIVAILCYVEEKGTRETSITTWLERSRNFNIDVGLAQFDDMVVWVWEEVSSNKLLEAVKDQFKEWNVLFYNKEKKKVETITETGGWVCWVTTGLYQNFLKDWQIDVTERFSHSNWYNSYYGKNKGADAMIYFWQSDFKFKNNGNSNIHIKAWGEYGKSTYKYYIRTKTLFKQDREVSFANKPYKNKAWDKTCYDVWVDWKKVTSCYRNILP